MIQVSPALHAALGAASNQPVDLYELYLDSGTLYYSNQAIEWGGRLYQPMVESRSAIRRYEGGQFDRVTVTLSNVALTAAGVLLTEEIEGCRLIIRKIDRTVAGDSVVLFNGEMERPSSINEKSCTIEAKQIVGSIEHEAPARLFSPYCPFEPGEWECGLAAGTPCDKSWSRCAELGNTARYGGFRFVPHGGTYQYEEVTKKRFLLLFSRKKKKTITAAFNAVDDTPYDVPIPIIYGRVQIAGIDIQHEDQGGVTKVLSAFCGGRVQSIFYVRANQSAVTDYDVHYGDLGALNGPDPRFPHSYPYSLVAYAGVTVPSSVTAVDPAPEITAIVMGKGVKKYGPSGEFVDWGWSDNPVWCVRDFMECPLAQGGMGIPEEWFDDAVNYQEAAYCDELILDTTNDQKIYSPPEVPADVDYRRYRSTGIDGSDPTAEGPYADYVPGVDDDTSRDPEPLLVKRFTMNVAIAKQEKAIDILFKKLLPSFRGYLTFSKEGKIQIRCERPVPNSTLSTAIAAGSSAAACSPALQVAVGDTVLLSPFTGAAEALVVSSVAGANLQFATPCQFAHPGGAQVLKIAMSFDDSNMVGGLEYPLSDRQPSTNRVTIKYVDAPSGFEARELRVNDYEHQAKVHRVENEDLDGSAIDSYCQAWRIGQWRRTKARDLGKFCSFRADIKATLLEIGDVIAVSATECGLQCVPFRVIELAYEENDEVTITGQLYSLGIYSDSAPQTTVTVPVIFGQSTSTDDPGPAPAVGQASSAEAWYKYVQGIGWTRGFRGAVVPPEDTSNFGGCEMRLYRVTGFDENQGPFLGEEFGSIAKCGPEGGAWTTGEPGAVLAPGTDEWYCVVFVQVNSHGVPVSDIGQCVWKTVHVTDSGKMQQNAAAPTLVSAGAEYKPVDGSWFFRYVFKFQHPLDTTNCKMTRIKRWLVGETNAPAPIWEELVSTGPGTHEGYTSWYPVPEGWGEDAIVGAVPVNLLDQEPEWTNDALVPKQAVHVHWDDAVASGPNGGFPTRRLDPRTFGRRLRLHSDGSGSEVLEYYEEETPAPAVTQFEIGTVQPDGSFVAQPQWDTLNERMLLDWACYLPEVVDNLGGVGVFFRGPGTQNKWLRAPNSADWVAPIAEECYRDSFAIYGAMAPGEQWEFRCVTANRLGICAKDEQGNPVGPSVTLTITAPDRGITASNVDPDALGPGIGIIAGKIGAKIGAGLAADATGYIAINPGTSIDVQDGRVAVKQGSLTSGFFAPGALGADLSKYTADKRPVGVYYGLPSVYDQTVPEVIFNSYDGYLYRKVGLSWTKAVAPGDIVAGTIAANVTMAGTVYSNKIVEQGGGIFGVRLQLNLNNVTVSIANLWDASYGQYAGALVQLNGGNNRTLMSYAGIGIINANGQRSAELSGAGEGYLAMGSGFTIQAFGDTGTMNARVLNARDASSNVKATLDGPNGVVNAQNGYRVGGIQIVDAFRNLSNVTLPAHSHASDAWFTGHAHDARYYQKSEVYTKAEVDALLSALWYHTHSGTTEWVNDHEHDFTTGGPN